LTLDIPSKYVLILRQPTHKTIDWYDSNGGAFQQALLPNLGEMQAAMEAAAGVEPLTGEQVAEINSCLEQSGIVGRL